MQTTHSIATLSQSLDLENVFAKLPLEVRLWMKGLSWNQRRYMLAVCHLMCAASSEVQARFLDHYVAESLTAKILRSHHHRKRLQARLSEFNIQTQLNESLLKTYIQLLYIHETGNPAAKSDLYLESATWLAMRAEKRHDFFNYILGFELVKMMFRMSWLEHERLYSLQSNQDGFIHNYIKPIQKAHKLYQVVVPKDETLFFARRNYFIQKPNLSLKQLVALVINTFTTDVIINLGRSVMRCSTSLLFDYNYIFEAKQETVFI